MSTGAAIDSLLARVAAAGGPDAIFDAGMARAIELGYVERREDGMVRLLDAGRERMNAAAERAGVGRVNVDESSAEAAASITLATTALWLELVEPEHRADTAAPPDEWTVPGG